MEVTVRLSPAGIKGGYANNPFPVLLDGSIPVCWNAPRVSIPYQPTIPLDQKLEWMKHHVVLILDKEEAETLDQHHRGTPGRPKNGLLDMKQTMQLIFFGCAGIQGQMIGEKLKTFLFHVEGRGELVFFANSLRHDHGTGSIFMDAWLLRTGIDTGTLISKGFRPINISEEELPLWKCSMPSMVER